jgi:hypothetical protein
MSSSQFFFFFLTDCWPSASTCHNLITSTRYVLKPSTTEAKLIYNSLYSSIDSSEVILFHQSLPGRFATWSLIPNQRDWPNLVYFTQIDSRLTFVAASCFSQGYKLKTIVPNNSEHRFYQ